jgi:hypothetical protein
LQRFTYAISLGAKRIPDKMEADFAKALPRFSCVSLRESSSFETIKPYLSPDATTRTDIDPTLLLSAEDWEHIAPERQGNPGYVFVYWLGSAKTLLSVLDALSKTRQKSRIKLALNWDYLVGKTMKSERISPSSFVKFCRERGIELCIDAGPAEFVSLVRDASAVVSNSFHAMAFSAIHRKSLRLIVEKRGPRAAMSDRFSDFAERYGIGDCFVDSPDKLSDAEWNVDWTTFDARIVYDRERSLDYLRSVAAGLLAPQSRTKHS